MTLGVFALVTAEFLPASLLTPMAAGLGVSEGVAGQTVTVTAIVAMVTSLFTASLTRSMDRRWVLLGFSVMLLISNFLVAFAPSLAVVLAARVILGIALGGFWTMAAATTMRLVPESHVPRALSILFSGVSLATIAAAPLGSYFGGLIGWRAVFLLAAGIGTLAFVWKLVALPSMSANGNTNLGTLIEVLKRQGMARGMFACILVFTGHFAFFTYLRPFLETVTGVNVNGLSAILLGFGVANFIGTSLAGLLLERSLWVTLVTMPFAMALIALVLLASGTMPLLHAVLVSLWGMAFGAIPVAWTTWVTRIVPDEAESGGGLMVAAVQLAITTGAAMGGVVFDAAGVKAVFVASALVLLVATLVISFGFRAHTTFDTVAEDGAA
ncbi:MAG: Purine ribonucleoside efflux pump NepI [Luteibacter sp.]|uniref:MFS transporter n=1 Tax=Luteibacter sp. TaxID=1886636 RepID=UPI001382D114|nr:MFS transporter [Luteibacter sp.]KAF1004891.1 MAG: Purine ribonucleoside efflux pump NepI [Luteibacter sp.]